MRGADPPVCAAHAGHKARGGPKGNPRARQTGFYSRFIGDEELADLATLGDDATLTDEIAAVRVAMRRVMAALGGEGAPYRGPLGERLAEQVFEGARTVARLLRERNAISGKAADSLSAAIGEALDQLNILWGTDL